MVVSFKKGEPPKSPFEDASSSRKAEPITRENFREQLGAENVFPFERSLSSLVLNSIHMREAYFTSELLSFTDNSKPACLSTS